MNNPPKSIQQLMADKGYMEGAVPQERKTPTALIHDALCAPFDKSEEKKRKQKVSKRDEVPERFVDLTYIDARAVMNRLDEVVGPAGWQSSFKEVKGVVVCELRVLFGDVWIVKSDGAGETDIEGEKGQFSDAFKRAAVHFGIGRYLYGLKPQSPGRRPTAQSSGVENIERKPSINPDFDAAELAIKRMMRQLNEGVVEVGDVRLTIDDAVFAMSKDEKLDLFLKRFDAPQRKVLKESGLDWTDGRRER